MLLLCRDAILRVLKLKLNIGDAKKQKQNGPFKMCNFADPVTFLISYVLLSTRAVIDKKVLKVMLLIFIVLSEMQAWLRQLKSPILEKLPESILGIYLTQPWCQGKLQLHNKTKNFPRCSIVLQISEKEILICREERKLQVLTKTIVT